MSVKQKRHWHVSLLFFIPSLLVSVAECGGGWARQGSVFFILCFFVSCVSLLSPTYLCCGSFFICCVRTLCLCLWIRCARFAWGYIYTRTVSGSLYPPPFSHQIPYFFSPRLVLYICYCLVVKALISTTTLPTHLPTTINTRLLLSTIAAEDWQLVIAPFCFCFLRAWFFLPGILGILFCL